MATMVRKQVYLEPRQDRQLKHWAEKTGKTEAEILRQALDDWLVSERQRREAQAAWEEVQAAIEERKTEPHVPEGRKWTREELYQERLDRYDRRPD